MSVRNRVLGPGLATSRQVATTGRIVPCVDPTTEVDEGALSLPWWGSWSEGVSSNCSLPIAGTSIRDRRCLAFAKVRASGDRSKGLDGEDQEFPSRVGPPGVFDPAYRPCRAAGNAVGTVSA